MTFDDFVSEVRGLLEPTASGKGYNATGVDGANDLYEFIQSMTGGHGHALGEIVYKARRYAAKGNREDVLKIAAWAFLILKHQPEKITTTTASWKFDGQLPPRLDRTTCACAQGDGDDGA